MMYDGETAVDHALFFSQRFGLFGQELPDIGPGLDCPDLFDGQSELPVGFDACGRFQLGGFIKTVSCPFVRGRRKQDALLLIKPKGLHRQV